MKTVIMAMLMIAFGSSVVFARINETIDEATARYGQGKSLSTQKYMLSGVRGVTGMESTKLKSPDLWKFLSGSIEIYAATYKRNDGKTVISEIAFRFPKSVTADSNTCSTVLSRLLSANSEGNDWASSFDEYYNQQWERPGVKAIYLGKPVGVLRIITDEYYQSIINAINKVENNTVKDALESLDKF